MKPGPLSRALSLPLIGLVRLYRFALSPLVGARCRFLPTCSEYAETALERYGAIRGGALTVRRLLRCHPWGGAGHDPVPAAPDPSRTHVTASDHEPHR